MKFLLLSIVSYLVLLLGCSKNQTKVVEEKVSYEKQENKEEKLQSLQESTRIWDNLKNKKGTTYQYTNRKKNWGGTKSETTIVVKDDFVQKRYYRTINKDNIITSSWKEEGFDALNNHAQGAPTKRIDDLYQECQSIISSKEDVVLRFDHNGVLTKCNAGKSGVSIENLVFLGR